MDLLLGEFTRDQMIAIFYHVNIPSADPFSNPDSEFRRFFYGVTGTPHNRIDGVAYSGSYADIATDAGRYRDAINADLAAESPILMSISGRIDATEGFVKVTAEAVEDITDSSLVIRMGVCEDHISYSTRDLRYVLRVMPLQESIDIPDVGAVASTARFFSFDPTWNVSQMKVIAFVQSDMTKTVFQSILFEGTPVETVDPLPITTNWAIGTMPTIDGIFNPGEWSQADETFVDLSYYVNFPFYVYSMNDDTFLYLCIDAVGDPPTGGLHSAGIYFDTDEDGILTNGQEDAIEAIFGTGINYQNWNGSDWVTRVSSTNGVPFPGTIYDEGGMIGAVAMGTSDRLAQMHVIYEFKIPLALGQLNAAPGDLIRPFIYLNANREESYWSPHTDYADPSTYGEMTLSTEYFTPTPTITPTDTIPLTHTPFPTNTSTFTSTFTPPPTDTVAPTFTPTDTDMPTFTPTNTVAPTFTPTFTASRTFTATRTAIPTKTLTPTPLVVPDYSGYSIFLILSAISILFMVIILRKVY